jgi:hypothetical protein
MQPTYKYFMPRIASSDLISKAYDLDRSLWIRERDLEHFDLRPLRPKSLVFLWKYANPFNGLTSDIIAGKRFCLWIHELHFSETLAISKLLDRFTRNMFKSFNLMFTTFCGNLERWVLLLEKYRAVLPRHVLIGVQYNKNAKTNIIKHEETIHRQMRNCKSEYLVKHMVAHSRYKIAVALQ